MSHLGATAARSLAGKIVTISKLRGDIFDLTDATRGLVTIHPSWLLRMDGEKQKEMEYRRCVSDLRIARQAVLGR